LPLFAIWLHSLEIYFPNLNFLFLFKSIYAFLRIYENRTNKGIVRLFELRGRDIVSKNMVDILVHLDITNGPILALQI
jgi:hypothetical protein